MHDRITDIPFSESVDLSESDPQWETRYQREKDVLTRALKNAGVEEVVEFAHFGSTSIEGIKAKPIIGLLCGVEEWEPSVELIDVFIEQGYLFYGQMGRRKRYYFRKRNGDQFFNIHVVEHNKGVWKDNLLFRDFMNCFSFKRKEYQTVKEQALIQSEGELNAYGDIKYEYLRTNTEHSNAWHIAGRPEDFKEVERYVTILSQQKEKRRMLRKKFKQAQKQYQDQLISELFIQQHPEIIRHVKTLETAQEYSSHLYRTLSWEARNSVDSLTIFWESWYSDYFSL